MKICGFFIREFNYFKMFGNPFMRIVNRGLIERKQPFVFDGNGKIVLSMGEFDYGI